jgi:peptide/nickel transport system permease protein
VVRGVSFEIANGEVMGLVGESGSGKTQTAFAILGLLPTSGRVLGGSIRFQGHELAVNSQKVMNGIRGTHIAYIPQEPMSNLDPSFTVGSQLTEPLRICMGMSRRNAKARALELLARVGIPDPKRTFAAYPHEISGGMAQRVLIAGAVSCAPDLIIADEPTTALDVTVQAEILDLLRELQRESDTALLLVTHNFGVVADLCDSVAVMQDGRIVEAGPVRSIFHDAEHPYTQSLLASILDDVPARAPYVAPTSEGSPA